MHRSNIDGHLLVGDEAARDRSNDFLCLFHVERDVVEVVENSLHLLCLVYEGSCGLSSSRTRTCSDVSGQ